jgi:hypothetical protein
MSVTFRLAAVGHAVSIVAFLALMGGDVAQATTWRSTLGFRPQGVGTTSAVETVTVKNSLPTALPFGGVTASGDYAVTAAPSNPCGATIPAGASCSIGVTFTPTQLGARSGTLAVTAPPMESPFIVILKGKGTKASLSSMVLLPMDPMIPAGALQQFGATGFFPGGIKLDLTTLVRWRSSSTTVAIISNRPGARGLAIGRAAGVTTISASLGSTVSSSTTLTVAAATAPTVTAAAVDTPTDTPKVGVTTTPTVTAAAVDTPTDTPTATATATAAPLLQQLTTCCLGGESTSNCTYDADAGSCACFLVTYSCSPPPPVIAPVGYPQPALPPLGAAAPPPPPASAAFCDYFSCYFTDSNGDWTHSPRMVPGGLIPTPPTDPLPGTPAPDPATPFDSAVNYCDRYYCYETANNPIYWHAVLRWGSESFTPTTFSQTFYCDRNYCFTFSAGQWNSAAIDPNAEGLPPPVAPPAFVIAPPSVPNDIPLQPFCDQNYCYELNHYGIWFAHYDAGNPSTPVPTDIPTAATPDDTPTFGFTFGATPVPTDIPTAATPNLTPTFGFTFGATPVPTDIPTAATPNLTPTFGFTFGFTPVPTDTPTATPIDTPLPFGFTPGSTPGITPG